MDDKLILGGIIFGAIIIYQIYIIKKDGNLPAFIATYVLLGIVFLITEVENAWKYIYLEQ